MQNNRTAAQRIDALTEAHNAKIAKIQQKDALENARKDARLVPLCNVLESLTKRKSVGTSYLNASHPQSFRSRWFKSQLGNLIFDLELRVASQAKSILEPQIESYTQALTDACAMVQNGEDPTDFVTEIQQENSEDMDASLTSALESLKSAKSRYNDLVKLPAKQATDEDATEMRIIEAMILENAGIDEPANLSARA